MRNKKRLTGVLISAVIISVSAQSAFAGSIFGSLKSILAYNEQKVSVKLDGKNITFPDTQPYVNEDNRTLVPVRFISEALGCKVSWEETRQLVTIEKDTTRILLRIGENFAIVNTANTDTKKEFDTKAVLKNDRTMVPLRFVSETLGAGVAWDEANSTVILRSDGTVEAVTTPAPVVTPTPTLVLNGGWTIADKPNMEKKEIQVMGGMTLEIALNDPLISKLMELKGLSVVSGGEGEDTTRLGYNEYHKDGVPDRAMDISYTPDMKNIFFDVRRDSEETRARLKSAIQIIFPDNEEMQKQIYNQIIAYKSEGSYLGYNLNDKYRILVKKNVTTWSRDDDSMGVWCKVALN